MHVHEVTGDGLAVKVMIFVFNAQKKFSTCTYTLLFVTQFFFPRNNSVIILYNAG